METALLIDLAFRAGFVAVFVVPGVLLVRKSERSWVRASATVGLIGLPLAWFAGSAVREVQSHTVASTPIAETASEIPIQILERAEAFESCIADGEIQNARYDMNIDWPRWCADQNINWLYQHGLYVQDARPTSEEQTGSLTFCHVTRGCDLSLIQEIAALSPYRITVDDLSTSTTNG